MISKKEYLKKNKVKILQKSDDRRELPFNQYLLKHHQRLDKFTQLLWTDWLSKYVEPAFDENRHQEMVKNFGYTSVGKHDFQKQSTFYNELKADDRVDEEIRKFIGFMAGSHFFDKYITTLHEWFNSKYWARPDLADQYPEHQSDHTINEILEIPYGLNYLKEVLLGLNHWRRD